MAGRLTRAEIEAGLRGRLKLTPDSNVIAHVNLTALGPLDGDEESVLDAILACAGTVVMPAFTYQTQIVPQVGPPNNALDYGSGDQTNARAEIFRPDLPAHPDCGSVAEAMPPDRNHDGLDLRKLLDDFERDGRLPGDDVRMVERRDDGESLLRRDLLGRDAAVFGRAAREHDLPAPPLHALDLRRRRGLGHGHDGPHAELLGGIGDRLAVIAGGVRDDPALARGVSEFPDGIVCAADFERADRLLVLELEMSAQLLDVDQRCAASHTPQPRRGFLDVLGSDHATSWAWGVGPWAWTRREAASRRRRPRPLRLHPPSRRAPRPRPDRRASGS